MLSEMVGKCKVRITCSILNGPTQKHNLNDAYYTIMIVIQTGPNILIY